MAFQSLYRRYRPQRFGELRGQDHVSQTLRNAVRDGRVSHAYLFSGPRGTGKTSSARILAKALNCAELVDGEPCGTCESCTAITEGRSLDVFELDAASNNGVDAMRDLVARTALGSPGRWKIYIVDEAHMLSAAASNTLLKTLEEPPGHVVFVLATTEAQKVLPTITSRTQHFEFRLLSSDMLAQHLRWVVADAGLDVADEAVELVARRGNGSVRDALSALDQVVAAGGIHDDGPSFDELVEALAEKDLERLLTAVAERCVSGRQPRQLAGELLAQLRQGFLATVARGLVALSDDDVARVESQARTFGRAAIVRAMEVLGQALMDMRDAPDQRVVLEVALVRLCRPETDPSVAALLERIERLEGLSSSQGSVPAVSQDAARPTPRSPSSTSPQAPGRRAGPDQPSPLASLRQVLATPRVTPTRTAASGPPRLAPAPPPPPRVSPPPAGAAPTTRAPAAPAQGFPDRDQLTLAWADAVLAKLSPKARARFRGGRFVDLGPGVAGFALPSGIHRDRCAEVVRDVETALGDHFGRPVRLELVVDSQDASTTSPSTNAGPAEEEEAIDPAELRDAPPTAVASPVDQLLAAFEGATVVEE